MIPYTRRRERSPASSLLKENQAEFLRDILAGLRSRPKRLPCKYFYDRRGSQLFEQICELDEYYLARTELTIMRQHAAEIVEHLGPSCMVIELGSGNSTKTRWLLDHLASPAVYVPVDICQEQLLASAAAIAADYPTIEVKPLCADFSGQIEPPDGETPARRRIVYFPGSTIGNFQPHEAHALLTRIASLVGPGGGLLIGIDLKKDVAQLEAAYNDARGLTALFNKNLLRRINRELGADFSLGQFGHYAFYNEPAGRIEMHLVSRVDQRVTIRGTGVAFSAGEPICTEYSYKYDPASFYEMARRAGLTKQHAWSDPRELFAVAYFVA